MIERAGKERDLRSGDSIAIGCLQLGKEERIDAVDVGALRIACMQPASLPAQLSIIVSRDIETVEATNCVNCLRHTMTFYGLGHVWTCLLCVTWSMDFRR